MTREWSMFLALHGGEDPGCGMLAQRAATSSGFATCVGSGYVHQPGIAVCERCALMAGYKSLASRDLAVNP